MKKILVLGMLLLATSSFAATFDWNATNWSAGNLNGTYTDVDGSGVDITVNVTGDTQYFVDSDGDGNPDYPAVDDADGYMSSSNYFEKYVDFSVATDSVTVTIKFSVPVKLSSLRWRDIDGDDTLDIRSDTFRQ